MPSKRNAFPMLAVVASSLTLAAQTTPPQAARTYTTPRQAELTQQSIAESAELERWLESRAAVLAQIDALLRDIESSPAPDLAMLTVASRALRGSVAG